MPKIETKSEKAFWANEIAALASEGESTEHIWQTLDLTRGEVEEIYRQPEFESAMRKYGDEVWETWQLSRAESRQRNSIQQKILDRADDYYEELHNLAMSENAKDEVKKTILLEFLHSTRQLGVNAESAQRVELSPNTVHLINRGDEVLSRHRRGPLRASDNE